MERDLFSNQADFKGILQQKFDSVEVQGNKLVICYKSNCVKCNITGNAALVQQTLTDNLTSLTDENGIGSISDLKNLSVIDFATQGEIKNYIDDLVFSLYFKVKQLDIGFTNRTKVHSACARHKYYQLINDTDND